MLSLTLAFATFSFIFLSASRLALVAWQRKRVQNVQGLRPIMLGGLRIDAHVVACACALPAVLAPWIGTVPLAHDITLIWYMFTGVLIIFMEMATPAFLDEYDTRPNRLFFEYLKYPREVGAMLWKEYRAALLGGVLLTACITILLWFVLSVAPQDRTWPLWSRPLITAGAALLAVGMIRGTLKHRPINPSTVAFGGDGMVNTLPLNSLYSVLYSMYSMKNERSSRDAYGELPTDEMLRLVHEAAGTGNSQDSSSLSGLRFHASSRPSAKPMNLVIIVEESLGAQFSGVLGGSGLTPELDALMQKGWNLRRTYATGTRSVRGLEALVCGFPPTPAQAVLKLPRAQQGFFTIADLLGREGYHSSFLYGGEAHFDNMKGFFLGNGFNEVIDLPKFQQPAFVGTWGASDEDMFAELHRRLERPSDRPTFTLAFTVSNHSPWEYPPNRISQDGAPATPANAIRYADWALGRFFEMAQDSDYWENTVFLVVADHDAKASGAALVPVERFHIPALILGATIAPQQDERLISQIDLAPTLLSLIGISSAHPMIGHDLTRSTPDRAMMQYSENYAYMRGNDVMVLQPKKPPVQYVYQNGSERVSCDADPVLARIALAHALWPEWAYRNESYTLGPKGQDSYTPQGLVTAA